MAQIHFLDKQYPPDTEPSEAPVNEIFAPDDANEIKASVNALYNDAALYGPYSSTALACASVTADKRPYRIVGISVSGKSVDYWWPSTAVADSDLVVKLPVITTDTEPTFGSTNPVQSGGTFDAIDAEADLRTSGDVATLASARSYADDKVSAEATARVGGDAATLASAQSYANGALAAYDTVLKAGVPSDGNDLLKLYNKIVSGFSQISVANTAARDAYNVDHLPLEIFVIDDGDGKWALYKALTTGVAATFIKISDPDLLNAVMTNAQIKAAYEANSNTNAFTDALLAKLSGIAPGATANSTDAYLLARANHTGTQTAATISDFAAATIAALPQPLGTASNPTFGDVAAGSITVSGPNRTNFSKTGASAGSAILATVEANNATAVLDMRVKNGATGVLKTASFYDFPEPGGANTTKSIYLPQAYGVSFLATKDDVDTAVASAKLVSFVDDISTAYTLQATDTSKEIRMNNAAANTVIIPTDAALSWPIGASVLVRRIGAGLTTIVAATPGTTTLRGQNGSITTRYNNIKLTKQGANLWALTGMVPDTSVIDGPNGSFIESGSNALLTRKVAQVAGAGNSFNFSSNSVVATGVDTGFITGNGDFGISIWIKALPNNATALVSFGDTATTDHCFGLGIGGDAKIYMSSQVGVSMISGVAFPATAWYHILVSKVGNTIELYVNNVLGATATKTLNITLNGTSFGMNKNVLGWSTGRFTANQTLIRMGAGFNSTERASLYSSGGGNPTPTLTANDVRLYNINDGAPNASFHDEIGNNNLAISNYVTGLWLGPGSGIVPTVGTTALGNFIQIGPGIYANEKGQMFVGDPQCGMYSCGYTIKDYINGTIISRITGSDGKTLFSNTNLLETARSLSTLGVDGNLAVGTFGKSNAAPANGMAVSGRILYGTAVDNLTDQVQNAGTSYQVGKLKFPTGSNSPVGNATLVAGTVTVSNTQAATTSLVNLTRKTPGGTIGDLSYSVSAGSLVITSANAADTSVITYHIIN